MLQSFEEQARGISAFDDLTTLSSSSSLESVTHNKAEVRSLLPTPGLVCYKKNSHKFCLLRVVRRTNSNTLRTLGFLFSDGSVFLFHSSFSCFKDISTLLASSDILSCYFCELGTEKEELTRLLITGKILLNGDSSAYESDVLEKLVERVSGSKEKELKFVPLKSDTSSLSTLVDNLGSCLKCSMVEEKVHWPEICNLYNKIASSFGSEEIEPPHFCSKTVLALGDGAETNNFDSNVKTLPLQGYNLSLLTKEELDETIRQVEVAGSKDQRFLPLLHSLLEERSARM
jgi:hypothetical protein